MTETIARRLTKALWVGCFVLVLLLILSAEPGVTECDDAPIQCEGE